MTEDRRNFARFETGDRIVEARQKGAALCDDQAEIFPDRWAKLVRHADGPARADAKLVAEDRIVAIAGIDPAVGQVADDLPQSVIGGDARNPGGMKLIDEAGADLCADARRRAVDSDG